jgi:hypothetical protein
MKFLNFFLLLWVVFALLDPDPDFEYVSGSTDLNESGSGYETLVFGKLHKKYVRFCFLVYSTCIDVVL